MMLTIVAVGEMASSPVHRVTDPFLLNREAKEKQISASRGGCAMERHKDSA